MLIWNYLGQVRLYSLADLLLFLFVIGADIKQLVGGALLWIGFCLFLEARHKHSYRASFPPYLWTVFLSAGVYVFGAFGVAYLLLGILYSEKKRKKFSIISPLFRGLQTIAMALQITHFTRFVFLAGTLIIIRNILGDVRDAVKDADDGLMTFPVLMGLRRNVPYVHLAGMMITSLIWWSYGGLPAWVLFCTWTLELSTYHLTPR